MPTPAAPGAGTASAEKSGAATATAPASETALLAPWQAAYARVLGTAPALEHADIPRLRFVAAATPTYAATVGHVRLYAHARVREHLRALGYGWGEDGSLTVVPTPLVLRPRLQSLGLGDAGYTPEYHVVSGIYMAKATWLARQCAGFVPVSVGAAAWYRRVALRLALHRVVPAPRWREHLEYHLHGVQHDMTKHALMLHLVPAASVRALGEAVRAAADEHGGRVVPEPLTRFYENDLTAYCQAIWRDLPDPAEFAPTFTRPANLRQLHAALDRRVAETRRGLAHWLTRAPERPPPYAIERPPARR